MAALVTLLLVGSSRARGCQHGAECRAASQGTRLNQLIGEVAERLLWAAACVLERRLKSEEFLLVFFLTKQQSAGAGTMCQDCACSGFI